ncbi:Transposable element P transposase [Aphis craccivora]|uniref:Transposable element P transposase n=1 Tax=Aphis craccivora TaxID=307492 RepID=A0A6G0YGY6_APHCR|nr:Transposable element P transposase [Aphis craccivora]
MILFFDNDKRILSREITLFAGLNVQIILAYILLNKCKNPLEFVLTYKLSQDHLKPKAIDGSYNKPNTVNSVKFKNTLRRLLLFIANITVDVESGNCSNFDYTEDDILEF